MNNQARKLCASFRPWTVIITFVLVLIGTVGACALIVGNQRGRITTLQSNISVLESQNSLLRSENAAAAYQLEAITQELEINKKPRRIRSPVDFPIMRVMAKPGDTVETLAEREGSTIEVLRALNPWLENEGELVAGQMFWLPKK